VAKAAEGFALVGASAAQCAIRGVGMTVAGSGSGSGSPFLDKSHSSACTELILY